MRYAVPRTYPGSRMSLRGIRWLLLLCALTVSGGAVALDVPEAGAISLMQQYQAMRERMAANARSAFRSPIVIESTEASGSLKGDIYAIVAHPFAAAAAPLADVGEWCDILTLHLNVKYCRVKEDAGARSIVLFLGRKFFQPLPDAYRLDFAFRVAAARPDYLQLAMSAASGPFGTRDYRLFFEAVPIDAESTFIHFSYAYSYGMLARVGMQAYLATVGGDKVGFTVAGKGRGGEPLYVEGVRGVLERNTMRYYLAIEAYLGALSLPGREQFENRLQRWFSSTELYHRQLYEIDQADYLEMKRREYARMQKSP